MSASKSCQIVLSGSHSSNKNLCNLCICINEEIHRNSISKYHILLCAQQPQPFHHLSTLHNAEGRKTTAFVGGVRGLGWPRGDPCAMLRGYKWNGRFFSPKLSNFFVGHNKVIQLMFFSQVSPGLYSAICWMFWSLGCMLIFFGEALKDTHVWTVFQCDEALPPRGKFCVNHWQPVFDHVNHGVYDNMVALRKTNMDTQDDGLEKPSRLNLLVW